MLNDKQIEFINEADGIAAVVTKIASGYSVAVKDLDTGNVLDSVLIYKTEAAAIAKAKEVI